MSGTLVAVLFFCSHFLAYNSIGTTSGLMDIGPGLMDIDVGRNVFVLLL